MNTPAKRRLCIIGAGGHGSVVADAAECGGGWAHICFVDRRYPALKGVGPWEVFGSLSEFQAQDATSFIVAIGDSKIRLRILDDLMRTNCLVATVVHPSAVISPRATLEPGCVVLAGVCVNIGVRVGRGSILNTGSTVDHDCQLAEGVHISPGAHLAADVIVGRRSWIGVGASVRNGITLGDDVTVGAGAAVVSPVPSETLVVGVPAKAREHKRTI